MTDLDYRTENERSRERLESLVSSLEAADYGRSVGGGWTVASVLGHAGFWDRYQAERWKDMLAGTGVGPEVDIEAAEQLANRALERHWGLTTSPRMGQMAIEAADELDALIATAPSDIVEQLRGTPNEYLLRRYRHRNEHLDQIDRALQR